jgi:PHD/YefM family antitoxin component YafN of YafNO toxin-antitoxin module
MDNDQRKKNVTARVQAKSMWVITEANHEVVTILSPEDY